MCAVTHSFMRHAVTHSYMRQHHMHNIRDDSFDMWHDCFDMWPDSVTGTWLIHMCDVTPSYVRRDSFKCATPPYALYITWLLRYMTWLLRHGTWLIHWYLTHSYVGRASFAMRRDSCTFTWLMHMHLTTQARYGTFTHAHVHTCTHTSP